MIAGELVRKIDSSRISAEELRGVIESAGITPDHTDVTQLARAIQGGAMNVAAAGGTADALTASLTPPVTALTDGLTLHVRAAAANATTTPTLSVDGLAAKVIVKGAGLPLAAGDIAGAGHWLELQYDATLDVWVLASPATGVVSGYMLVRDEKASGTDGGSASAGIQTRVLNTVSANTIPGASLASNQVTLPAGTYRIWGSCPAADVNSHKSLLYSVTDGTVLASGSSENCSTVNSTDTIVTRSIVSARVTLAAAKVFELRHYISSAKSSTGLGLSASATGTLEVYSQLEIIKEA